jgi:putative transposase
METVRIYQLTGLRPRYRSRLRAAQLEAAQVWMLCRDLHLSARQQRTPWPGEHEFQRATKGRFALHSQTIQAIFRVFLGTVESTRELRTTNPKIRYPYKDKRFYPLLWPAQAVSRERERIVLPMGAEGPRLPFASTCPSRVAPANWCGRTAMSCMSQFRLPTPLSHRARPRPR